MPIKKKEEDGKNDTTDYCDGCYEFFPIKELTNFAGYYLCKKCKANLEKEARSLQSKFKPTIWQEPKIVWYVNKVPKELS